MDVPKILVSACLGGRACRHDGGTRPHPALLDSLRREGVEAVLFCPEEAAGLGTPRSEAHLEGGDGDAVAEGRAKVVRKEDGADLTESFLDGARQAVERALEAGCTVAYLKERSPSCGCGLVHTTNGVIEGCGVTAALLRRAGIATISVD
ncbi:MAG: 2-thiouracil desulfurase family protein [Planctomycetota bacterium]